MEYDHVPLLSGITFKLSESLCCRIAAEMENVRLAERKASRLAREQTHSVLCYVYHK